MIDSPSFDKPAFVRKHPDTTTDIVNVRFNVQERAELEELKAMLSLPADSTALKTALTISLKVLQGTFGKELLAYLCGGRRVR